MKNYAYSLKTTKIKEPDFPYQGQKLTCASDLVQFARNLQDSDVEKMLCLYLDAQNTLICLQVINGTVNQAMIYPREVFKHALLAGATSIILIHNHPSGAVHPSDADINLTKKIMETGKVLDILVHDHLIIAGDKFFSLREEGLINFN